MDDFYFLTNFYMSKLEGGNDDRRSVDLTEGVEPGGETADYREAMVEFLVSAGVIEPVEDADGMASKVVQVLEKR